MSEIAHPAPDGWLKRFFLSLVILALLAGLLLVPWAVCWLTASGELDQEEVVARQAQGEFVLFGPGLAQDIMAYKLALYAAVKPEVVVLGSSRAGNVRAAFFERPFVNMAGAATDLESLRLLVDRIRKKSWHGRHRGNSSCSDRGWRRTSWPTSWPCMRP